HVQARDAVRVATRHPDVAESVDGDAGWRRPDRELGRRARAGIDPGHASAEGIGNPNRGGRAGSDGDRDRFASDVDRLRVPGLRLDPEHVIGVRSATQSEPSPTAIARTPDGTSATDSSLSAPTSNRYTLLWGFPDAWVVTSPEVIQAAPSPAAR